MKIDVKRVCLDLLCHYLRVDSIGFEKIPKKALRSSSRIIPALLGSTRSCLHTRFIRSLEGTRILAHHAYFDWSQPLRNLSFKLGLREPHASNAAQTLEHGHLLIVFPEGEAGNFKSSIFRYRLQPFHTGFLRIAQSVRAPILPCIITGAEESHFNLGNINIEKWFPHSRIPLPLNLIPLPAKSNLLPEADCLHRRQRVHRKRGENPQNHARRPPSGTA